MSHRRRRDRTALKAVALVVLLPMLGALPVYLVVRVARDSWWSRIPPMPYFTAYMIALIVVVTCVVWTVAMQVADGYLEPRERDLPARCADLDEAGPMPLDAQ